MKNVKKLICLALALIFALTLAACGATTEREFGRSEKDDREESNRPATGMMDGIFGGREEISVETRAPEAPVDTPVDAPAMQAPQLLFTLSYYEYETMCGEIAIYSDNTFEMTVNLYEGYGKLTGTYFAQQDNTLNLTVSSKDFSGFAGDNLVHFDLVCTGSEQYTLVMLEAERLGMLENGDIFTRTAP